MSESRIRQGGRPCELAQRGPHRSATAQLVETPSDARVDRRLRPVREHIREPLPDVLPSAATRDELADWPGDLFRCTQMKARPGRADARRCREPWQIEAARV